MDPQGWKLWTSAKACRLRFSSSQEQISIELRFKHHVSSSTLHFLNASSPSSTILLHIQYSRSPTSGAQAEELVEVFAFHLALVLCINSIVVLPLNAARAQECENARAHLEQLVPFLSSFLHLLNASSSNATLLHIQYPQQICKHQPFGLNLTIIFFFLFVRLLGCSIVCWYRWFFLERVPASKAKSSVLIFTEVIISPKRFCFGSQSSTATDSDDASWNLRRSDLWAGEWILHLCISERSNGITMHHQTHPLIIGLEIFSKIFWPKSLI